jgi:signal transduction histidine kinase
MFKLHYIVIFLIAVSTLFLSIVVFHANPKNKINRSFTILSFFGVLWIISNFFENEIKNLSIASILLRLDFLTAVVIIYFFLRFCYFFLYQNKKNNLLLKFLGACCVLFVFLTFTDLIIKNINILELGIHFNLGYLFYFYALYLIICVALGLFYLGKKYHNSTGISKLQSLYIILGFSISFVIALFINLILPVFNIVSSELSRSGIYVIIVFIVFTSYSIVKYRLMDIRLVVTRSILYFLLILIVASTFIFITFITGQLLQGKSNDIAVPLVVSLIIVIGLDPLKRLLAKWTDVFFYKAKIDFQQVLRNIGEIIARELDLEKLSQVLEASLQKELKVKYIQLFMVSEDQKNFILRPNSQLLQSIDQQQKIINYLQTTKKIVVIDELARQISDVKSPYEKTALEHVRQALENTDCALIIPIMVENKLNAVILAGSKLSGSAFTNEDINFFSVLGPQIANALERSKLYEEVQQFNIKLQYQVKKATTDLEERNMYLVALQKMTNVISRSLDFQNVMQTIADDINTELGFIGGVLSFINFENNTLYIGAMTQTSFVQKALSMIPQDPVKYAVPLDFEGNSSIRAIKTQQMVITQDFYESVAPALPRPIAHAIQKIMNVKSVASVPVFAEQKVIGDIDFILAKEPRDITDVEKEMMYALANQVGIVFRNLQYYREIQKANEELKDANVRLQQLDKAKSEFLSIASHQLRTPLTGIKGYLSMIIEGDYGAVPPEIKRVLDDVFMNSDRLTRLVNIFLNVSRIESGRFELALKLTDITKLIEEVITELMPEAKKKNLNLIFNKPTRLIPFMMVDRDKIKDVVLNLIDNSIKYTPTGQVEVIMTELPDKIQVSVKDTGVGMLMDEVKDLFKKFARGVGIAQIDTTGSGLGLYIAKKIIEAHNGEIWAESPGKAKGSTFSFTLPKKSNAENTNNSLTLPVNL